MTWFLVAYSVVLIIMAVVIVAMYDNLKLFKFLLENFVITVQKLVDNSVRENKNVAANINMIKEAIKNANSVHDSVKNLDAITKNLASTATVIKVETTKLKRS